MQCLHLYTLQAKQLWFRQDYFASVQAGCREILGLAVGFPGLRNKGVEILDARLGPPQRLAIDSDYKPGRTVGLM